MSFLWVVGLAVTLLLCFSVGQGDNEAAHFFAILSVPAVLLMYFAPATIAAVRKHPKVGAISILNLLAGWTVFGWVAAIVWSYTAGGEMGQPMPVTVAAGPKKCPFCAEQIHRDAIKCRHCGSDLENAPPVTA